MVWVEVTDGVRSAMQAAGGEPAGEASDKRRFIRHGQLAAACNAADGHGPSFETLLREAKVYFSDVELRSAEAPARPRHPELEARLEKLRQAQDQKEYTAMVHDVAGKSGERDEMAEQIYSFKSQLSMGMNVLATMATCFAVGYFLCYVYRRRIDFALIGGLVGMIIALMVDVVIIIVRVYAIDKATASKSSKQDHLQVH